MPRVLNFQTNFVSGVLDPRLAARTDIKQYYQGCAVGTNVLSLPQGGLKRRPGMAYQATLPGKSRICMFAFNVEQTYLISFSNNNIAIYKDGVKQADVTSTYTEAQIFELNWTQSADTMIIVHEDHAPAKLVRGGSHTAWTLSDLALLSVPVFNFGTTDALNGAIDASVTTITVDSTTGFVAPGADQLDGAIDASVTDITVDSTVGFFAPGTIKIDSELVTYLSISTTQFIGCTRGAISTTAASHSDNAGVSSTASITIGTETITYTGVTGTTFTGCTRGVSSTAASHDDNAVVSSTDEPVWSATKGYPKSATFFEQRLWFGGSKNRPQTMWASVIGDFFNFNVGTGADDDAIDITLDTDQVNAIKAVYAGRHLTVFTSGAEFYISDSPITPAKSAVKRQTQFGSGDVRPVNIDGAILFIERSGKAAREFLWTYEEEAYTSNSSSLMASHLITSPVDMDARRGTSTDDANYVYLVNSDGTMAVFNTLRHQEVGGWTKWSTTGTIESVAVIVDDIYFSVLRTINSVAVRFLEKANESTYTDANKLQTLGSPGTAVSGLAHLNGESCRVRADDALMDDATPSGGAITLVRNGTTVEVGLDYDITVKTMPLNSDFQNGPILTRYKRLVRVVTDLYQSLGVYVNDVYLADRDFGEDILDTTPPGFTGIKETHLLGWDRLAQITITQQDPQPFTLLAVAIEVEA